MSDRPAPQELAEALAYVQEVTADMARLVRTIIESQPDGVSRREWLRIAWQTLDVARDAATFVMDLEPIPQAALLWVLEHMILAIPQTTEEA